MAGYDRMHEDDVKYMRAALKLARRGLGSVEPNPAVGCIIVKANQVVGTGYHKQFGGGHAEINALEDCKRLGVNPKGAAMYVTLEPCCHEGKTGACTKAIIAAGITEVIVAAVDPSEHAGGKGIEQLRQAGIEVREGICEAESKYLNAPFLKYATTGKCWVVVKWAQSLDGKLAWANQTDEHRWISCKQSRNNAHKLRRRVQGILVGINTVLADNPRLTPRPSKGKKPLRIVLDNKLRIPLSCRLLSSLKNGGPVLIFTSRQTADTNPQKIERIKKKGAEIICCPDTQGRSNLHFVLDELSRRGVGQLLVEGGPTVISSFLKEQLVDEARIYIAPKIMGMHGSVDLAEPMAELTRVVDLHDVKAKRFGEDVCLTGLF